MIERESTEPLHYHSGGAGYVFSRGTLRTFVSFPPYRYAAHTLLHHRRSTSTSSPSRGPVRTWLRTLRLAGRYGRWTSCQLTCWATTVSAHTIYLSLWYVLPIGYVTGLRARGVHAVCAVVPPGHVPQGRPKLLVLEELGQLRARRRGRCVCIQLAMLCCVCIALRPNTAV